MTSLHVLVIGGIPSVHEILRTAGAELTLLPAGGHPPKPDPALYRQVLDIDPDQDRARAVAALRQIAAERPFDHVVCLHDTAVITGAEIAQDLNLPCFSPEIARRSVLKNVMREVLQAAGLDQTAWALACTPQAVQDFGAKHGWPVVIKPVDGRASRGVQLLSGPSEVPASLDPNMMVEAALRGREFSVESLSNDANFTISQATQKFTSGVVECGHVCPPRDLSAQDCNAMIAFAEQALKALGQTEGVGHTEVFVNGAEMAVVETHLRGGGDRILDLVRLTKGWDLPTAFVHDLLGRPRRAQGKVYPAAAVWFLLPEKRGTLRDIGALDTARGLEGVVEVTMLKRTGDEVGELRSSYDRLALAVAIGETPSVALERAQAACKTLTVTVEIEAAL